MTVLTVVEIVDGDDDDLVGYAVAEIPEDDPARWRLLPEIYGTRSQAWAAADSTTDHQEA